MWLHISVTIGILLVSAFFTQSDYLACGIKIAQWFNYIIARGFYLLIISMIVTCFAMSLLQDKLQQVRILREIASRFSQSRVPTSGQDPNVNEAEELEILKLKLFEAERNVQIVRSELEEAQNRSISDLTSLLEDSELEKTHAKNDFVCTQVEVALEIEKMKQNNAVMQKQLERAQKDNERLSRQLEVLRREARISEAALKDQDNLSDRLDEARSELNVLKSKLQGIKQERDAAVHMAAEHMYKMVSDVAPQKIDAIEEMIDAELRRVREEEEAAEDSKDTLLEEKMLELSPSEASLESSADSAQTNIRTETYDQEQPSVCSNTVEYSACTNTNFSVLAKSQSLIESWTAAYVSK